MTNNVIEAPPGMKWCAKCGEVRPHDEFYWPKNRPSGSGLCKTHHNSFDKRTAADRRDWSQAYNARPDIQAKRYTTRSRFEHVMYRYGITEAEYWEMDAAQKSVCAICHQPDSRGRLHVDHDHDTKKVRALLCGHCNKALGLLRDNPETAHAAAAYLSHHKEGS